MSESSRVSPKIHPDHPTIADECDVIIAMDALYVLLYFFIDVTDDVSCVPLAYQQKIPFDMTR